MKPRLTAIGTAVPRYKQTQSLAAEMVAAALQLQATEKRLLKSIYRKTGIDYRHSVMSDFLKPLGEYEFFPNDLNLPFPSTAKRMQVYQAEALPLAIQAVEAALKSLPSLNLKSK